MYAFYIWNHKYLRSSKNYIFLNLIRGHLKNVPKILLIQKN